MKRLIPLVLLALTLPAKAQTDPAVPILSQSAQTYATLTTISQHFATYGPDATPIATGEIQLSYPHQAKIEARIGKTNVLHITDGEKLYSQLTPKSYRISYAEPKDLLPNALKQLPLGFTAPLSLLFNGKSPLESRAFRMNETRLRPDGAVELSLRATRKSPAYTFRLYIDPTDHFLYRIESTATDKKGNQRYEQTFFSTIRPNAQFGPGQFTYQPAPGVELAIDPPLFDPKLVPGVAPYPLKGTDLQGKTHSWKDYEGKVVLLDFWATWCAPCVAELPNVLANYKKYRKDGFEVLGVSLDDEKADLMSYIKAHHMTYPQFFKGKSEKNIDAVNYGVRAIPYTLLIGKDGKIAAVNASGERLEEEILKALAK